MKLKKLRRFYAADSSLPASLSFTLLIVPTFLTSVSFYGTATLAAECLMGNGASATIGEDGQRNDETSTSSKAEQFAEATKLYAEKEFSPAANLFYKIATDNQTERRIVAECWHFLTLIHLQGRTTSLVKYCLLEQLNAVFPNIVEKDVLEPQKAQQTEITFDSPYVQKIVSATNKNNAKSLCQLLSDIALQHESDRNFLAAAKFSELQATMYGRFVTKRDKKLASVLVESSEFYKNAGLYRKAYSLAKEAANLSILEPHSDFDHRLTANLGLTAFRFGDNEAAITAYLRAITILETLGKQDTSDYSTLLHNIGKAYIYSSHSSKAEEYLTRALALDTKLGGAESNDALWSEDTLALALLTENRIVEAEPHVLHSFSSRNKPGIDDSEVFTNSLNGMALLAYKKGKLDDAENYARQALNLQLRFCGENHGEMLNHINTLVEILIAKGNYLEPLNRLRIAISLEKELSPEHIECKRSVASLARLPNKTKFEKQFLKLAMPSEPPSQLLQDGRIAYDSGNLERSVVLLERALNTRAPGKRKGFQIGSCINYLAAAFRALGARNKALDLCRKWLQELQGEELLKDKVLVAIAFCNASQEKEACTEIESIVNRLICETAEDLGPYSKSIEDLILAWTSYCERSGQAQKAVPLLSRLVKVRTWQYGELANPQNEHMVRLADIYFDTKDYIAAANCYKRLVTASAFTKQEISTKVHLLDRLGSCAKLGGLPDCYRILQKEWQNVCRSEKSDSSLDQLNCSAHSAKYALVEAEENWAPNEEEVVELFDKTLEQFEKTPQSTLTNANKIRAHYAEAYLRSCLVSLETDFKSESKIARLKRCKLWLDESILPTSPEDIRRVKFWSLIASCLLESRENALKLLDSLEINSHNSDLKTKELAQRILTFKIHLYSELKDPKSAEAALVKLSLLYQKDKQEETNAYILSNLKLALFYTENHREAECNSICSSLEELLKTKNIDSDLVKCSRFNDPTNQAIWDRVKGIQSKQADKLSIEAKSVPQLRMAMIATTIGKIKFAQNVLLPRVFWGDRQSDHYKFLSAQINPIPTYFFQLKTEWISKAITEDKPLHGIINLKLALITLEQTQSHALALPFFLAAYKDLSECTIFDKSLLFTFAENISTGALEEVESASEDISFRSRDSVTSVLADITTKLKSEAYSQKELAYQAEARLLASQGLYRDAAQVISDLYSQTGMQKSKLLMHEAETKEKLCAPLSGALAELSIQIAENQKTDEIEKSRLICRRARLEGDNSLNRPDEAAAILEELITRLHKLPEGSRRNEELISVIEQLSILYEVSKPITIGAPLVRCEELRRQAYALAKTLSPRQPNIEALKAFELAEAFRALKKYEEAMLHFRRSKEILEQVLPKQSQLLIVATENLARMELQLGQLETAKQHFQEAISSRELQIRLSGTKDNKPLQSVITTHEAALGQIEEKQGNDESAKLLYQKALNQLTKDDDFFFDVTMLNQVIPFLFRQQDFKTLALEFEKLVDEQKQDSKNCRSLSLNPAIRRFTFRQSGFHSLLERSTFAINRAICSSLIRQIANNDGRSNYSTISVLADAIEHSTKQDLKTDLAYQEARTELLLELQTDKSLQLIFDIADLYPLMENNKEDQEQRLEKLFEQCQIQLRNAPNCLIVVDTLRGFSRRNTFEYLAENLKLYSSIIERDQAQRGPKSFIAQHCKLQVISELGFYYKSNYWYELSEVPTNFFSNFSKLASPESTLLCDTKTLAINEILNASLLCQVSSVKLDEDLEDAKISSIHRLEGIFLSDCSRANQAKDIAVLHLQRGNLSAARDALNTAISLDNINSDRIISIESTVLLAEIALLRQDLEEARDELNQISRLIGSKEKFLPSSLKQRLRQIKLAVHISENGLGESSKTKPQTDENGNTTLDSKILVSELLQSAKLEELRGNIPSYKEHVHQALKAMGVNITDSEEDFHLYNSEEEGYDEEYILLKTRVAEEMAQIYMKDGKLAKSLHVLLSAKRLLSNQDSLAVSLRMIELQNLQGEIFYKNKDFAGATNEILQASTSLDKIARTSLPYLSFAEQCAFVSIFDRQAVLLHTCCRSEKEIVKIARFTNYWNGLLVEALRQQSSISVTGSTKQINDNQEKLAQLLQIREDLVDQLHGEKNRETIYNLEKRKEQIERSLNVATSKIKVSDPVENLNAKTFSARLKADEAYISIVRYENLETDTPWYGAIVYSPTSCPQFAEIGSEPEIDELTGHWLEGIQQRSFIKNNLQLISAKRAFGMDVGKEEDSHNSHPDSKTLATSSKSLQQMAEQIWRPVKKKLSKSAVNLFISPIGSLANLPWDVLATESNTHANISIIDSPRELILIKDLAERVKPNEKQNKLLLVGDISFGDAPQLTETGGEINEIEKIAQANKLQTSQLTKLDATKGNVRKQLADSTFAHFATHGFFQAEGSPSPDRQLISTMRSANGPVTVSSSRSPLMNSGLLLATAKDEKRASHLTAEEILSIDLSKCKLVTLSACDTGLGRQISNQGALGLRSALISAGAETVIMSMWKVDDEATRYLMQRFYFYLWTKHFGPAKALSLAQEDVKSQEKWRDPVYWAAWQIAGRAW